MVTSHIDDPEGLAKIEEYISAAGVARKLRNARIGIVGHAFEGMTDLMVDLLSLRQFLDLYAGPLNPRSSRLLCRNFQITKFRH